MHAILPWKLGINGPIKEGNEMTGWQQRSSSLKLINGGPNKVRGLERNQKINERGAFCIITTS